ncbi:CoA transferase [Streptomyces sp. NBC_01373]|uniref:CoA transferase n=1 Tax=Streptomyces sp. NBC_01373 TaxID=2903843 RepID=UPI00224E95C8|nr:CoA transferase [Streptomyces sp. NBC_01373]MCX4705403.1 CoA transferase [Streptomyces sp. NBC_01373]
MTGDPAETVRRWLRALGDLAPPPVVAGCPYLDWAASGGMALTGETAGPPVLSPAPMMSLLGAVGGALSWLGADIDPALLLGSRAGAMDLTRRGRTSAGGASRLLPAADGWLAVTLSRPDDIDLVPAILGRADVCDPWQDLATAVRGASAREFTARIRMVGVPAAVLPTGTPVTDAPWQVTAIAAPHTTDRPLVVDLSSLWAGPLCAHLLGRAGARVVKVESTRRPDGARAGNRRFYDWLHAGQESVAVDFTTAAGRAELAELVDAADVVIEASRPRALAQLGLDPERLDHRPGKVWVGITGYGRARPDRVAFGDDAAVAGGLVARSAGGPVFCADAIADPLTGLVAALGALASLAGGGGQLIDLSMRDVAAAFAGARPTCPGPHPVRTQPAGPVVQCRRLARSQAVLPPCAPTPEGTAATSGRDTGRVLAELRDRRRAFRLRARSGPR